MANLVMVVAEVDKDGILDIGAHANVRAGDDADTFTMPNDGRTVLVVEAGTGDTFTFTAVPDKFGRTETLAPVVAAGKFAIIGPFLPDLWNDSTGYITITPTTGNSDDFLLAVRVNDPS